jgi:hypothetical protein
VCQKFPEQKIGLILEHTIYQTVLLQQNIEINIALDVFTS